MWLHVPTTSCASAPASEASSLESASRDQALAVSATCRGKSLPPRGWSRVCKTGPFTRLLSGLTSPPSTACLGVDSWIASLRATRASQTASPERASEKTTIDGCSITSSASSMRFGLLVSSERTSLGTRTDSLRPSSRHWKEWVTALRLEYSQRAAPEPVTSASASSSWPTATVMDHARSPGADFTTTNITLNHAIATWSTPSAHDGRRPGPDLKSTQDANLDRQAATWATPNAADSQGTHGGGQVTSLRTDVSQWETPSVAVTAGSRLSRGGDRSSELLLTGQAIAVSAWPTPTARDFRSDRGLQTDEEMYGSKGKPLARSAMNFSLPPVPTTPPGSRSSDPRRISLRLYLMLMWPRPLSFGKLRRWAGRVTRSKLNPSFVDWMHGWPSEWTDCEQAVTGFRPWLLRSRGELSRLLSPPTSGGQLNLFD